jgi:hypothetical protein
MQRMYLDYDQVTTRAFGKVAYMREITVVAFTGRSSPRPDRYIGSERVLSIRLPFCLRGLGCHEVSHDFLKQRYIGENVEGGHGQSLALLHGTVVSV